MYIIARRCFPGKSASFPNNLEISFSAALRFFQKHRDASNTFQIVQYFRQGWQQLYDLTHQLCNTNSNDVIMFVIVQALSDSQRIHLVELLNNNALNVKQNKKYTYSVIFTSNIPTISILKCILHCSKIFGLIKPVQLKYNL